MPSPTQPSGLLCAAMRCSHLSNRLHVFPFLKFLTLDTLLLLLLSDERRC